MISNPLAYNFVVSLLPSDPPLSSDADPTSEGQPLIIGSIGSARENEIGYMFHPAYWGKGYATEAIIGFLKKYFEMLPGEKYVIAKTDVSNSGSRRVLEKSGFKETAREKFDNPTLGEMDAVVYEYRVAKDVNGEVERKEKV
jgi:ribosomal-protein-alanine N-acetyltransferase